MKTVSRFGLISALILGMGTGARTQSNSALLEKGIYAEETLGNLQEAINAYLQIIGNAEASRPVAAQALFRLGICYQKSGKQREAQAAFFKLAQLYPEQKELIARIPSRGVPAMPQLLPAPWQNGETMEFVQHTKADGASGLQVLRVESVLENGHKAWHFEWLSTPGNEAALPFLTAKDVIADLATLLPFTSENDGNGFDWHGGFFNFKAHARFFPDHAQIQPSRGSSPGDIPLKGPVYDECEILQLVRCLPLTIGLQMTIPLFNILDGTVTDAWALVEARDRIDVPAGTLDCYRVLISRGPRGTANEQTVWITADRNAYIAKASFSADNYIELSSAHPSPADGDYEIGNPNWGFRFRMPGGWRIYRVPHENRANGGDFTVIPPGRTAKCSLLIYNRLQGEGYDQKSPKSLDYLARLRGLRAQNVKTRASSYSIRGEYEIFQLCGFPALRVIGDFRDKDSDDELVDYYIYQYTGTRQIEIAMQVEKQLFEEIRPIFELIVNSLRFD